MHMPRLTHSPVHIRKEQTDGCGVIYTQASDFVHPGEIDKEEISRPMSAKPMGVVDVTANDWVYTGGPPSRNELRAIKKHTKQTAHVLRTGSKRVHEEVQTQQ
ncbi:hypothetical protein GGH94_004269 [Coemansia aciculifera]|uniref:Uncharacterized protein n=1 Tax=Coemansia aciculifera TaxID=417176 RepID=A0A9W8IFR6_9FUNG|nr:hypothetical protein GGH94_004269 [Coemansia aciculifera]